MQESNDARKKKETRNLEVSQIIKDFCTAQCENYAIMQSRLQKSFDEQKDLSVQASYARLLRGIAHEIKNPLAMLMSGSELILMHTNEKKLVIEFTRKNLAMMKRLNKLLDSMLRCGLQISTHFEEVDLTSTMEMVLDLSRSHCGLRDIILEEKLSSTPTIYGSPLGLQQLFINLILNAVESMDAKGGILQVSVNVDKHPTKNNVGKCIRVTIIDSGIGMTKEQMTEVSKPFVSHKKSHAGLGLVIVENVLAQHRAEKFVQSTPFKGTNIALYFPITKSKNAE